MNRRIKGCSATRCEETANCSRVRIWSRRNGASVEPILGNVTPLYTYEPGTWGPEEANQLIGADGPVDQSAGGCGEMTTLVKDVTFLFDVDNTLLNDDQGREHLARSRAPRFALGDSAVPRRSR